MKQADMLILTGLKCNSANKITGKSYEHDFKY